MGRQWQLMLMSIPMFLYVLFFNYYPMYFWVTAFQDYKPKLGVAGSAFVGWKNFQWLFGRADFINSIRNHTKQFLAANTFLKFPSILHILICNVFQQPHIVQEEAQFL